MAWDDGKLEALRGKYGESHGGQGRGSCGMTWPCGVLLNDDWTIIRQAAEGGYNRDIDHPALSVQAWRYCITRKAVEANRWFSSIAAA